MDVQSITLDEEQELLSYLSNDNGVEVTSFAFEKASPSASASVTKPVDDFFSVWLRYQDSRRYPNERNAWFEFRKDNQDVLGLVLNLFDDGLEFNVDANAYDCVIDVVQESCDVLLQQVSEVGRKSLAMIVMIKVDAAEDVDDVAAVDDEVNNNDMDYSSYEDEDVESDEEVMGTMSSTEVKDYLSSNGGVRFLRSDQANTNTNTMVECCSICLEEFDKRGDDVAVLPCSHVLHTDCLVPWISKGKDTCPMCRFNLLN